MGIPVLRPVMVITWLARTLPLLRLVRGQGESEPAMLRMALRDVAIVIAAAVMLGMLLAASAIALLVAIYQLLILQGLSGPAALAFLAGFSLILMLIVLRIGLGAIRRIGNIPKAIHRSEHPIQSFFGTITDAFMNGYSSSESKPKPDPKKRSTR